MALLFADGFDHYSWLDISKKWGLSNISTPTAPSDVNGDVRTDWARPPGGMGHRSTQGDVNRYLFKTLKTTYATLIGGGNFYFGTFAGAGRILGFYDSTTEQVSLRLTSGGNLLVSRNGSTLATSVNTLSLRTWYHIEFKSTINNTTGTYEVRVNGTSVGWIPAATGQNTRSTANNYATTFVLGQASTDHRSDDVYVLDTSGSVSADFIGAVKITTIFPSAAGNSAQWTGNYAANFANVNETAGDSDDTFNQSSTAAQIDLFGHDDIPTGSVFGVQQTLMARQDAGAQRSLRPMTRIGSTNYNGTTVNTAGTYQFLSEASSVSPATAVAWTSTEVNGAEFGYELVS